MPRDDLLGERTARQSDPKANGGRMAFAFLMLAQLIASLDNQLVATALPTIVGDLGQAEHFSWLVTAYVLAQCAVMPISGKLGDLIGRKRVMVTSLLIFSVGAVFCAVSWSMSSLIMARLVQGLGTGGILVSVFAVNADLFEPGRRARFQSYLSFVFVFGSFVGPTLGGYLTAAAGWRSIFLVTLPLAALSILGFLKCLPGHVSRRRPVIDFAGAIAIALTVTILVIWTDSARVFGSFSAPESLFLALAAGLGLVLSALIERRAPEPVLPPGLLRQWNFSLLCVTTLCSGAVSLGLVTYYAYFLQMAFGLSPAHSGLFFIALTVGVSSGALLSGQMMTRGWHFADPAAPVPAARGGGPAGLLCPAAARFHDADLGCVHLPGPRYRAWHERPGPWRAGDGAVAGYRGGDRGDLAGQDDRRRLRHRDLRHDHRPGLC